MRSLAALCLAASALTAATFPNAVEVEDWRYDPSLGWFVDDFGGWLWSHDNGWIYPTDGNWDTEGVYFYDHGMQRWMWSQSEHYPLIYAWGEVEGWQRISFSDQRGQRRFYDWASERTLFEDGYVVEGTVFPVSTRSQFDNAVANAGAGDVIEFTASLPTTSLSVKNKQVADGYVRIRAAQPGAIELKSLNVENSSGIIVEGFAFGPNTSSIYCKVVNSQRVRILRNTFDCKDVTNNQNAIVTTQASEDIEIAYNDFDNKNVSTTETQSKITGSYLKVQYDAPDITRRLHIHHNHFKNIVPLPNGSSFAGDSDRECIVFGVSGSQDELTDHVVEYNLFEDCDGENEIITVKTSRNTIRHNTFYNSLGSISIRFGTETKVYGNAFIGDEHNQNAYSNDLGGVRAYGSHHQIYNNYFQGLNGNSYRIPILLDSGDTSDSTGGDGHERATHCVVAHNTIVDCAWGIALGLNYSLTPKENLIANNLVQNRTNNLYHLGSNAAAESSNTFAGNLGHPLGSANLGLDRPENEIRQADPLLVAAEVNGWPLYRLGQGSPAVDAATALELAVAVDLEGQSRDVPDVGADEVGQPATAMRLPVNPADVGPNPLR
ncbi:MAG: polysaccharide lyase 6 family protein [Verrucomicrobiota bacterium JB022]|nr:polysaccharide lyase 6 family protein [Verrucomicrobiota bacterium JB022]